MQDVKTDLNLQCLYRIPRDVMDLGGKYDVCLEDFREHTQAVSRGRWPT